LQPGALKSILRQAGLKDRPHALRRRDRGFNAEKLFDRYSSFGDDPFIRAVGGSDDRAKFSAWTYAKELCRDSVEENRDAAIFPPGGPTMMRWLLAP
jgi:hypothetical protein